jgi:EmrB/QacA subfamily drug resistance transporter
VLALVAVGTLFSAMSGSMVGMALPDIGGDLGVPVARASWVLQAFLLTATVLVIPAGRLGDLLGHRRVYLAGYALVGACALLCGFASHFGLLVAARAVQGAGSAMVMATGPALLTTSRPASQRGRALGVVSTATYIGLAVGPGLGGLLVEWSGWRGTFFLLVPVVLLVLALGSRLPADPPRARAQVDLPGLAVLLLGFPWLLIGLGAGGTWGWAAPATLACLAAGVIGLALFTLVERRQAEPLLRLELFGVREFQGASLSALANYAAVFVPSLLMPYYLRESVGLDPSTSGLVLTVQPVAMALVASPSGWLSDRVGTRTPAVVGMLLVAAGMGGLAATGIGTVPVTITAAWYALVGLGTGVFISPNSSALMGSAPRDRQGTAGALLAVSRTLGMMVGVALGASIFGAVGGRTGLPWQAPDQHAFRLALGAAMLAALLGAAAASYRSVGGAERAA